ncbi:unnamed protein product [Rotaria magnacalcarata]|uniref:RIIa domain-containing protein n=1 Tax=Rotaria magnacalcarata TaxID=392030 RepID=A0A819JV27_9BILA|nr:unnamed protein product [Rotaria magnacalcarata]CAF1542408.1 unnamed protein product [Rotaria magnacalcarata]CAF1932518.1 unnamed protein product [Rotaria magnacalcarata]CAF2051577.1 unnamed protein product [Rotaria magnacalcarata]CAF2102861.1 unnamed protein product [Rotaria magnacalcarata]
MDAKPIDDPPHSTEKYDEGALLPEQQKKINELKIQKRIENERYLQKHPELNILMRDFIRQTCLQKPEDIRQFSAGYFTHPMLEKRIENLIKEQIETINAEVKVISEEIFQR